MRADDFKADSNNLKKYDLHIHTSSSICSSLSIYKLIETAFKKGLQGIAVTDHNTTREGVKAVKLFRSRFREKFNKWDFEIIVGEEIMTNAGEILAFYLTEDIKPGNIFEVIEKIKEEGAIASLPHPFTNFRMRFGKGLSEEEFKEVLQKVDAVEAFNSRNFLPNINRKCEELAQAYSKAKIAGSDAHFWFEIGSAYTLFPDKLSLKEAIRKRKTKINGTSRHAVLAMPLSVLVRGVKSIRM